MTGEPRAPKPDPSPPPRSPAQPASRESEPASDTGVAPDEAIEALIEDDTSADDEDALAAEIVEEPERALVRYRAPGAPGPSDPLARYIEEVRQFAALERDEEIELARRFRDEDDREAATRLVTANLMLVVKLALMYRRALRNVMDLIQEGNVGLMEALKRFDPDQGVRFSTYASWWIKAYILKFLLDNARLVRVGTTNARRKLLFNLRKEQRRLEAQGITPTPRLLAGRLGVSEEDVVEVDKALSGHDVSTDAPLTAESQTTVGDMLPDEREVSVEDEVVAADLRERIDRAIARFRRDLNERDRALLDERLVSDEPRTLQELGDRFGVTREAMRQAETKLKRRLAVFLRDELGDDVALEFSR